MNKFLKFFLIAGGIFVFLLAGVTLYISVKYPPEKLKAIATEKLSETLKRKVTVGEVRFNILNGFELKNLKVSNRPGWAEGPFVSAKDISISYHLFELLFGYFSGQISLGEIRLNEPEILVERKGLGQFNFSDIVADSSSSAFPAPAATQAAVPAPVSTAKAKSKVKSKKAKHKIKHKPSASIRVPIEAPMDSSWFADQAWADTAPASSANKTSKSSMLISVGSINIIHGKMVYLDETGSPVLRYDLKDLDFKVKNLSMVGTKTTFTLKAPFTYGKLPYLLSIEGACRYYQANESFKDLQLKGTMNDLGFEISGEAQKLATDFTPELDGWASLDMLRFSGLVPKTILTMADGLSISGPAKVTFHLNGSNQKGLKLKGGADGIDLAIQYKDLFLKAPKTSCKFNFESVLKGSLYDVPSFTAVFQDWELDGAYHYRPGDSYSYELHSKSLPLKGLSNVVPRWKNVKFAGGTSLDLAYSRKLNSKVFNMDGHADMKDIGITLPQEPFLEQLTGRVLMKGTTVNAPKAIFKSFEGTGVLGFAYNIASGAHSFSLNLQNVNAQQAVNATVDAMVVKNPQEYHDKLFGLMNFSYQGTGRGTTGAEMEASAAGSGNYSLVNAKVKGYAFIKAINNLFKDKSEEFVFDKIDGNVAMKKQVVSFTANTTSKIGSLRVAGAVNFDGVYSPDMKVMCDIKKDYLDSDNVKGNLPPGIREKWDVSRAADEQGNVPIDFRFTGPAKKTPGLDCVDLNRMIKNITNSYAKDVQKAVQNAAQQGAQDLGNQLKGLFGK